MNQSSTPICRGLVSDLAIEVARPRVLADRFILREARHAPLIPRVPQYPSPCRFVMDVYDVPENQGITLLVAMEGAIPLAATSRFLFSPYDSGDGISIPAAHGDPVLWGHSRNSLAEADLPQTTGDSYT